MAGRDGLDFMAQAARRLAACAVLVDEPNLKSLVVAALDGAALDPLDGRSLTGAPQTEGTPPVQSR